MMFRQEMHHLEVKLTDLMDKKVESLSEKQEK